MRRVRIPNEQQAVPVIKGGGDHRRVRREASENGVGIDRITERERGGAVLGDDVRRRGEGRDDFGAELRSHISVRDEAEQQYGGYGRRQTHEQQPRPYR